MRGHTSQWTFDDADLHPTRTQPTTGSGRQRSSASQKANSPAPTPGRRHAATKTPEDSPTMSPPGPNTPGPRRAELAQRGKSQAYPGPTRPTPGHPHENPTATHPHPHTDTNPISPQPTRPSQQPNPNPSQVQVRNEGGGSGYQLRRSTSKCVTLA